MKFLSPLLFLAVIIFVVSNVMASPYPEEPLLDDNAVERANKEGCIRRKGTVYLILMMSNAVKAFSANVPSSVDSVFAWKKYKNTIRKMIQYYLMIHDRICLSLGQYCK
uniref:U5-Eretoxin-Ek1k_1 n=1 Tax=Eresus cinnaberinus TaxID=175337 RepID=A0A2D0PED2_ERECI